MKKNLLLLSAALIPLGLASCSIEHGLPADQEPTSESQIVNKVLNAVLPSAEEAASASAFSAELATDNFQFGYNRSTYDRTEYETDASSAVATNSFAASHTLVGGTLLIGGDNLDKAPTESNFAIKGHFDSHELKLDNDYYLDITASLFKYEGLDIALYVDSGKLYADLTDPELQTALDNLNLTDFVNNPKRIVSSNLFKDKTEPICGDNVLGKLVNFISEANDVIDAIGSLIQVEGWDNVYTLKLDLDKQDLINVYREFYKLQHRDSALSDEEINAMGEQEYSYLTINSFVVSLSFDHLTFTGFTTDIDIDLDYETVGEDSLTTDHIDFVLESSGSYKYGENADAVVLPDLNSYVG